MAPRARSAATSPPGRAGARTGPSECASAAAARARGPFRWLGGCQQSLPAGTCTCTHVHLCTRRAPRHSLAEGTRSLARARAVVRLTAARVPHGPRGRARGARAGQRARAFPVVTVVPPRAERHIASSALTPISKNLSFKHTFFPYTGDFMLIRGTSSSISSHTEP